LFQIVRLADEQYFERIIVLISFWGSDKVVDGWAATVILLLIFLLIERTLPPRKPVES
jgi:hypothetical protein